MAWPQALRCHCAIAAALMVASAFPAAAQSVSKQSLAGRYGLDAASCTAKDYFATVRDTAVDLPTYSCKGVAFDQTETKGGVESYAAKTKSCVGEGQTTGKPANFRIARTAGTIQFLWSDGTKSSVLTKC